MTILTQIIGGLLVLLYVVFMVSSWYGKSNASETVGHDEIDPDNSTQMGVLVGLTGGAVADAAVMRYALQRFEQNHGRKPTMQDAGLVVGLMNSMRAE